MSRPVVGVYTEDISKTASTVAMPAVFNTPIRPDLVQFVHTNMNKNHRQPHAVSKYAGHQTSAESWGTGRAVARIPRVAGGGTSRSGQGAFGNMCRKGRMFAPTKVWRRWHRNINVNVRRYAVASALAASAIPALVSARGHRIQRLPEVPLVVDQSSLKTIEKTKQAVTLLRKLGAYVDVQRVSHTIHRRAGRGKMRNRRYIVRRGPLVIYHDKTNITRAFRNLPGVDLVKVTRLNLLQLAPGGHLGRFCIWTSDAFQQLDNIFGTPSQPSKQKKGYILPRPLVTNPDLARIINAPEVQKALRPKIRAARSPGPRQDPYKNRHLMMKLNPYAGEGRKKRKQVVDQKRK